MVARAEMAPKPPANTLTPSAHLQALQTQLVEAQAAAAHAQREATVLGRQLMSESISAAVRYERKAKDAAGAAVRKSLTEAHDETEGVPPADPAAVDNICRRLNAQMRWLEPDPLKMSWYLLFKEMDADGSGLIEYSEFSTMVRETLKMSVSEMANEELMSVWNYMDSDRSGHVDAGEFGRFMYPRWLREQKKNVYTPSWKDRAFEEHGRSGREVRAETARLLGRTGPQADASPAGEGDLASLAIDFTKKMQEMFAGTNMAWYKLFKSVDDDGSGHISFLELQKMVRETLRFNTHDMPNSKLYSLWAALDDDRSGFVSAAEFKKFMDRGAHLLAPTDGLTWRPRMLERREQVMSAYREAERTRMQHWKAKEHSALQQRKALRDRVKQEKTDGLQSARAQIAARASGANAAVKEMLQDDMPDVDLSDVQPASAEVVLRVSLLLNKQILKLPSRQYHGGSMQNDQKGHVAWFKLFQEYDTDGSGLLSFREFQHLLRDGIRVTPTELPDDELQSVWQAIDADHSGHVTVGELGKFMKLGVDEIARNHPPPSWRERNQKAARAAAEQVADETYVLTGKDISQGKRSDPLSLYQLEKLMHQVRMGKVLTTEDLERLKAGERRHSGGASESEQVALSARIHARMAYLEPDPLKRSWFAFFRQIDVDGSGRISFDEFTDAVRKELQIPPDEIRDAELHSLWLALDADLSGFVTAGEFGSFMRKGEPVVEKPTIQEKRLELAQEQRKDWDRRTAVKVEQEIAMLRERTDMYIAASHQLREQRNRLAQQTAVGAPNARPQPSSFGAPSARPLSSRPGELRPRPPSSPRESLPLSARTRLPSATPTRTSGPNPPLWGPQPSPVRPRTASPRAERVTAPRVAHIFNSDDARNNLTKRPEMTVNSNVLPRTLFKPVLVKNSASGAAAETVCYRIDLKQIRGGSARRRREAYGW